MLTSFKRIIRSGFVGFWRNAYVSMASIFVITVALFVIGATIFVDQMLSVALTQLESKVDINVYFVTTAQEESIESLSNELRALPDVESVTYTSREEALAEYREKYKDDAVTIGALEELDENPLGATIAIQAKNTTQYESIARFLEEKRQQETTETQLIDDINYAKNKDSIDRLISIIDATERASYITLIVLIVAAVLITFNTIRLAIYTAREEISVMRLVGAGNLYIRGPFMLQGIMYGVVSTILTLLIFYPVLAWLGPRTADFLEFDVFAYFITNFATILLTLLGVGVALGLVSSTIAVTRYLRV